MYIKTSPNVYLVSHDILDHTQITLPYMYTPVFRLTAPLFRYVSLLLFHLLPLIYQMLEVIPI